MADKFLIFILGLLFVLFVFHTLDFYFIKLNCKKYKGQCERCKNRECPHRKYVKRSI